MGRDAVALSDDAADGMMMRMRLPVAIISATEYVTRLRTCMVDGDDAGITERLRKRPCFIG